MAPEITSPSPAVLAESDTYRVRALTPDEWVTRRQDLLQYTELPDPATSALIVVEDKVTGEFVATWSAVTVVMLHGLYLAPEVRTQSAVAKLLLGGMMAILNELNIRHPLTVAQDPSILAMARKAGFVPQAGTLLMLE